MSTQIMKVKIKHFQQHVDFEAEINGNNFFIVGDNDKGKSNFMRFMRIAFGDKTCIPPNANGSGEVITTKDGKSYTLKVKLEDGKPIITIVGPDGLKDTRKSAIAAVFGAIGFDPDKFVHQSLTEAGRLEQVKDFKKFLPEEVQQDLAKMDRSIKVDYDERTQVNKDIKEKETAVGTHRLINILHTKKWEKTDVSKSMKAMQDAATHNEKIKGIKQRKDQREKDIEKAKKEISDLEAEIKKLQEKKDKLASDVGAEILINKQASEWLADKANAAINVEALEKIIQDANDHNKDCEDAAKLIKDMELLAQMRLESDNLTESIEMGRESILDTIRDVDSPVKGVTFDETQLYYNGVPVNPNAMSTSMTKELAVRLKLAENPGAPIYIEGGESIGLERFNVIKDICKKAGAQMFIEQVQRGEAFHLEIMAA